MSKLLKNAAKATAQAVEAPTVSGNPLAILSQTPKAVDLFDLTLLGDSSATQTRLGLNMAKVAEYAEDMRAAPETFGGFPAIVVVEDAENSRYWVARGHHRVAAAKLAKLPCFPAKVYTGTMRDAIILGAGDNAVHGLKRTREDTRREIDFFLTDPEWSSWSDTAIADLVRCARGTVTTRREALVEAGKIEEKTERTYTNRYGKVSTMQVDGIQESNASRARVPLTDEEIAAVISTELGRRVTTGRMVDKINWLRNHRRFSYYTAIIADGRTSDDAAFERVADGLVAKLDAALQELFAANEAKASGGRYVAPEPTDAQATDAQVGVKIGPDKLGFWSHMRQLGKLLDDAAPLLRELLENCPADLRSSVTDDDVDRLIDLATVARAVADRMTTTYWSPAGDDRIRERAERAARQRLPVLLSEIGAQGGLMLAHQSKELRAIGRILGLTLTLDRIDLRTGESARLVIPPDAPATE